MSRPSDCYDNAVAESFFAPLKVELFHETVGPRAPRREPDLRVHRDLL